MIGWVENGLKYTIYDLCGPVSIALDFVAVYAESVHATAVAND